MIGKREFLPGQIIRTVSITEKEAAILNEETEYHNVKYEKLPEQEKVNEPNEKEIRKNLFEKAKELGLTPMKNIKTEDLKALINKEVE
jgi:hypothetical protein